ncbi:protein of unknown function [Blastococcus saxobsidens DD2]|uniref:Uncharacterized protein n=1 Tax=Blastococcus saxobsidens (strain DD2) TaxID=1146883 RepID=H6RT58_BLASD|nr:protein of unknown function [Blastococcus saxobsidens DD2]
MVGDPPEPGPGTHVDRRPRAAVRRRLRALPERPPAGPRPGAGRTRRHRRAAGDDDGADRADGGRADGDRADGDRADGDRAHGDRAHGNRAHGTDHAAAHEDRLSLADGAAHHGPVPGWRTDRADHAGDHRTRADRRHGRRQRPRLPDGLTGRRARVRRYRCFTWDNGVLGSGLAPEGQREAPGWLPGNLYSV